MIMLVREIDQEGALARIEVHGHVFRTTLSAEAESKLDAVLEAKSSGS
jgi:uncharacterized membrane protein